MKAASRRTAVGKREYKSISFTAGQATVDQHRLMLIRLAAAEPIQVRQSAGVSNSRISRRVGDFRRENRPHRRQHLRIRSRRYRYGVALRRRRDARILSRLQALTE